jgi:hypothetical protein
MVRRRKKMPICLLATGGHIGTLSISHRTLTEVLWLEGA